MSKENIAPAALPPEPAAPARLGLRGLNVLERITAAVLLAVVAALAWIVLAAYQPEWLRLPSLELEVVLVLGLLGASLILVSVVALLHTRT
jgi:hypothetical protein